MKLISFIGLLFFTTSAFGQLTSEDIDKLRLIVKEEVKSAIAASEKRMEKYIAQEIEKVNIKITEMDDRLIGEIKALEKNLNSRIVS